MSNGSGLKITTSEYFTPNHTEIDKKGIAPDEEVDLTKDEYGYYETSEDKDTQLFKAIEIIENKTLELKKDI